MTNLGKLFEEARKRLGLRVADVAQRAGYANLSKGVRRYAEIEEGSGTCPPGILCRRFAEVLGIDQEAVLAAIAEDAKSAAPRPTIYRPPPMTQPPPPFSIEVRGQLVEGKVAYVCPSGITVEITHPYRGLRNHCHIPYFSMHHRDWHFSREGGNPSTITESGWQTARGLLAELYEVSACVAEHRDDLWAALRRIQAEQEGIAEQKRGPDFLEPDAFREERRKLRDRLRKGECDQRQFGREKQAIHARKRAFEDWVRSRASAITRAFEGFVKQMYGRSLSLGVAEQIIHMLQARDQAENSGAATGS